MFFFHACEQQQLNDSIRLKHAYLETQLKFYVFKERETLFKKKPIPANSKYFKH